LGSARQQIAMGREVFSCSSKRDRRVNVGGSEKLNGLRKKGRGGEDLKRLKIEEETLLGEYKTQGGFFARECGPRVDKLTKGSEGGKGVLGLNFELVTCRGGGKFGTLGKGGNSVF